MSGPIFLGYDSGAIGGALINASGVTVNGFSGVAALFIESFTDEAMFDIYIGGRLNLKEKVCAERRTGYDKAPRGAIYPAVCSKVKP